jgi:hypothetical protein
MTLVTFSRKTRVALLVRAFFSGGCVVLCATAAFAGQPDYLVVDLTAKCSETMGTTSNWANYRDPTHPVLWTGNNCVDLHPAALLGNGPDATATIQGHAGNLRVGWGMGLNTGMRSAPIVWHGAAGSAAFLAVPFTTYGAQALGTDGMQIVGSAAAFNGHDGGPYHALVWNVKTSTVIDLGAGGNGAEALSVARGQQAGFTTRFSGPVATIWAGTAASQIVLHPDNGAVTSQLFATNGLRQAGFCGFDMEVVNEATYGRTTKRINKAFVWDATAASARSIHPAGFRQSYATGMNASSIVGYAYDGYDLGTVANYHAILWNSSLQPIDLNAFLPHGFTGAKADSIDAEGTIAGTIFTANGVRHAAVWTPIKTVAR